MRGQKRNKEIHDKLHTLCRLISNLDSVRAFKRIKPKTIETSFKELGSKELLQEWKKIRSDVQTLIYLPLKARGVSTLMRWIVILKIAYPFCVIFLATSLYAQLTFLTPIIIVLTIAVFTGHVILDFMIRRRIVKYETKYGEKFHKEKERVKTLIEKIIMRLLKELERCRKDPIKYKIKLFHVDYKRVKVIDKARARKYLVYTVVPTVE